MLERLSKLLSLHVRPTNPFPTTLNVESIIFFGDFDEAGFDSLAGRSNAICVGAKVVCVAI